MIGGVCNHSWHVNHILKMPSTFTISFKVGQKYNTQKDEKQL
jgi:hypothetical protein